MASLEAELSAANASLVEARSLVMDNRQALQKHKTWMQNVLVKEESLLGESPTHCCPFTPASDSLHQEDTAHFEIGG
jgi:hypothetical protein